MRAYHKRRVHAVRTWWVINERPVKPQFELGKGQVW
jgi:hypothetical protein